MATPANPTPPRRGIVKAWHLVIAAALAVAAFLTWYEDIRNKGQSIACDVAGLIGQQDAWSICNTPLTVDEQWALLEKLKAKKHLSEEQQAQLQRLEEGLIAKTLDELHKASGLTDMSEDQQAAAATDQAVRDTIDQGDPEERQALAMIADGDVAGGLAKLEQLATTSALENAAHWRRIGRLAYSVDTLQALQAYEKVIALDDSDPWDGISLGRLYMQAGQLAEARRVFENTLNRQPEERERDRGVLLGGIGNVHKAQGNLTGALASYRASLAIAQRLAEADPGNAQWQRDLSVSHNKIGDVQQAQGNLNDALASYRADMAIAQRLAEADPGNAQWQRDYGVSLWRLAGFEDSGTQWSDVADAWEAMRDRGILAPVDLPLVEEALRLADEDAGQLADVDVE